MPVSRSRGKRSDGAILTAFRLSPDAKAELVVIRRVLDLSTDVAAVQFAIRRTYNQLLELAPTTAGSPERLDALKTEELQRQREREAPTEAPVRKRAKRPPKE